MIKKKTTAARRVDVSMSKCINDMIMSWKFVATNRIN